MGILSTRSITAPLIDKRNLIAIVLAGVFFVVYRWSGGGVTTVPKGTKVPIIKPPAQTMFFEDFNSSPQDALKQLNQTDSSQKSGDFLGNLLGNRASRDNQQQNNNEAPGRKLDDIERSLGLR